MVAANLDATNLAEVDFQGIIHESVMNAVWDISKIPLPVTDLIGSGTHGNAYTSWTTDALQPPVQGGWIADGADATGNDAETGLRIGNQTGTLDKVVQVSTRADASDTIGFSNALSYQVMMRQQELRRDVEANMLGIQGSTEGDPATPTAGVPASLLVQMAKQDTGSTGSGGTFSAGVWLPWTPGANTALTETMIRDAAQAAYEDGGNPMYLNGIPSMIRALSEYMFTASARIATLVGETNNKGPAATALGSVNTFITDFGSTLDFISNRLQLPYKAVDTTTDVSALVLLDPAYAEQSFLSGYTTSPLAKTGLSEKRQMFCDVTFKALEPKAHRVLFDLDAAQAVTA